MVCVAELSTLIMAEVERLGQDSVEQLLARISRVETTRRYGAAGDPQPVSREPLYGNLKDLGLVHAEAGKARLTLAGQRLLARRAPIASSALDFLTEPERSLYLKTAVELSLKYSERPTFRLLHARTSNVYFQCDDFIVRLGPHRRITARLLRFLTRQIQRLRGVDLLVTRIPHTGLVGAYPLAVSVGIELDLPLWVIWQQSGTIVDFGVRPAESGMKCLLFQDVVTTGQSILEVEEAVGTAGGQLIGALAVFDRQDPDSAPLRERGIEAIPLLSARDVAVFLMEQESVLAPEAGGLDWRRVVRSLGTPIQHIDLGVKDVRPITVAVAQLKVAPTKTLDEKYRLRSSYRHARLATIARYLDQARELRDLGLLVLPELSVPWEADEKLRRFAIEARAYLVAGMEYDDKFHNVCRIYAPDGRTWDQRKLTMSDRDHRSMRVGVDQLVLRNTGIGNVAPVICIDLLQTRVTSLLRGQVDIIVVSTLNEAVGTFKHRCLSEAFDCHSYVVLANGADYGGSAVFGPLKGEANAILAEAPRAIQQLVSARVDVSALRREDGVFHRRVQIWE